MKPILREKRSARLAVLVFAAGYGWAALAASDGRGSLEAAFDADGRTFTVTAPGVIVFQAGWSATIERGGQQQVLSSTEGGRSGTTIRFKDEAVELLYRLEQIDGVPGVLTQAGIRNAGTGAVKLVSVTPVALEGRVAGNPAEWLVTALDKSVDAAPPVVALGDIRGALNVHEYGGLYRGDGAGFLFGPVGAPIAYVDARIKHRGDGKVSFHFSADMSGVRVEPGETRWGQQVVLLMEPPRVALARWAEWVAKTHGARTWAGALSGWDSSSLVAGKKMTGADVLAVLDEVRKSPQRLRPGVIRIDRGYEDSPGKAQTRARFPEELAFYARQIAGAGARPGLCVGFPDANGKAPLADPPAWADLGQRARQAVQIGFTYLAIDCAALSVTAAGDDRRTSFEAMRDGFADLRKAVGAGTYLLYGGAQPDRATVGAVDASRTGASMGRNRLRDSINDVLRSYSLQGRWFAVDNDMYYMDPSGAWPLARTWMSMVGLSCGAAITSDPWHRDNFRPHWRSVEVMTPPATERTEVLDLCTSRHWPRLVGRVTRDWGEWTVVLLWNPGATEQPIRLDFAGSGLDPERRYAVWSFWDNRFLGVAKGSWTTPALAPSTSQHLCFTDLDRDPDRPALIGSSLHIYCGAAEINRVKRSRGAMEIDLTDAGAREGDLFVYSRFPPFLKAATGCTAEAVDGAGENVWRIGLHDRQSGVPQRVELGILLPATRQAWFWMLIATVVASLLFAAWRYVVGLQLQRERALEQERRRIARDIHDEVGANLAQMSILSSLAARPTTGTETARRHNVEIAGVARQTIHALEEIVWSVNPKSDSIRSVAHFICRRAEEILEPGNVRCQITLDEALPERPMTPRHRHGLLLAFKEAVHNIVKHAGAKRVQIRCLMDGPVFEVRVSDDGCGFDPAAGTAAAPRRQGRGLNNMRQRLAELGGECRIDSRVGEGTQVRLRVPAD